MYVKFESDIERLNQPVAEQAGERPGARLLMTHPAVGPVTALATDVLLGDPARFADGKFLAGYVGMIPREYSSGGRQRLGGLSKQGNPLLRFLWGEAGAHGVRRDPELKRFYRHRLIQKGLGKARMAVARRLGIRLWKWTRQPARPRFPVVSKRSGRHLPQRSASSKTPELPGLASSSSPTSPESLNQDCPNSGRDT